MYAYSYTTLWNNQAAFLLLFTHSFIIINISIVSYETCAESKHLVLPSVCIHIIWLTAAKIIVCCRLSYPLLFSLLFVSSFYE